MPTMAERMAVVETKIKAIGDGTDRIETKVDLLLTERNERRGAEAQRLVFNRRMYGIVGIVSGGVAFGIDIALKALGVKI